MIGAATLLAAAVVTGGSSGRLIVGVTVVTPCKISSANRAETESLPDVTCADADQPQPRILRETKTMQTPETDKNAVDPAVGRDIFPSRTDVIF